MAPDLQRKIDEEFDAAIRERIETKRVFGQSQRRIEMAAAQSIEMSRDQKNALVTLRALMRWANQGKKT